MNDAPRTPSGYETSANLGKEVDDLRVEVAHWKANHACEVERARVLKDRIDMPLERVKAYEQIGKLQRQIAECHKELAMEKTATEIAVEALLARLAGIARVIEYVDNRCMAADGPVTPTREEITDDELREIYQLAKIDAAIASQGELEGK